MRDTGFPGRMLCGGARGLHHFTELVGGGLDITINWQGTADALIAQDPPVVSRIGAETPREALDELLLKVPDFRRAYLPDGLGMEEFADFAPVALFRSQFMDGWNILRSAVTEVLEGKTIG